MVVRYPCGPREHTLGISKYQIGYLARCRGHVSLVSTCYPEEENSPGRPVHQTNMLGGYGMDNEDFYDVNLYGADTDLHESRINAPGTLKRS
jgi:hypothetical protein